MDEEWRITPPILPIELALNTAELPMYSGRKVSDDANYAKGLGNKKTKFAKKRAPLMGKSSGGFPLKQTKPKQKVVALQLKNMQKFMHKINEVDPMGLSARDLKGHFKSKQNHNGTEHESRINSARCKPNHRRGYSEMVRALPRDEINNRKLVVDRCISGMNSLASVDYPQAPSRELQVDHDTYCMTDELPRRATWNLDEPDELALKVSQDVHEMKELATTLMSHRDEGDSISNKSTKNIIRRYISTHLEPETPDLLSPTTSIHQLMRTQRKECQISPISSKSALAAHDPDTRETTSDFWNQMVLNKVEIMLSELQNIPSMEPAKQNIPNMIDSNISAEQSAPSSAINRISTAKEERWVGSLAQDIEFADLDKFLMDRMIELYSKDGNEQNGSVEFEKWVKMEMSRIRRARDLLKTGIRQASTLLSKELQGAAKRTLKKKKLGSLSFKELNHADAQRKKKANMFDFVQVEKQPMHAPSSDDSISPWNKYEEDREFGKDEASYLGSLRPMKRPFAVSAEQREQLLELIFLEMCLEFIEEMERCDQSTKLVQCMLTLREIFKSGLPQKKGDRLPSFKRKGFGTTPKDVTSFLIFFMKSLLREETMTEVKEFMITGLSQPVGPGVQELLRYMRGPETSLEDSEKSEDGKVTFIFKLDWFETFSSQFVAEHDFGDFFTDEGHEKRRKEFLKSAMHIHNKAIFDSLNEVADRHRPYGLIGEPYPWKNKLAPQPMTVARVENFLRKACESVSMSSKFLCGLINDPASAYELSEQELQEIREDRMCKYLCHDVGQFEARWSFFDDEETELLICLAGLIHHELCEEAAREMLAN